MILLLGIYPQGPKYNAEMVPALLCSLWLCIQLPKYGNNPHCFTITLAPKVTLFAPSDLTGCTQEQRFLQNQQIMIQPFLPCSLQTWIYFLFLWFPFYSSKPVQISRPLLWSRNRKSLVSIVQIGSSASFALLCSFLVVGFSGVFLSLILEEQKPVWKMLLCVYIFYPKKSS